ncbi:MAG: ABC transporter ATP-binding protein [Anaerolineae bacterium]|nr:ABC transporter ATP-binding protein [Anaerolineae bacterium]
METGKKNLAIYTNGLTKHYGKQAAVDRINLEVHRGDLFGLLGPNGAGKTTTNRMLAGLVHTTSGKVEINGCNIESERQAALRKTGFVLDKPAFYPRLSGRNNLEMMARLLPEKPSHSVGEVLDTVGLSKQGGQQFHTYSLGMKRRLDIAAILLGSPDLLVLDEPTSGLDPAGAQQMRQLLATLTGEGKTVLFSSHLMSDVEKLCNRVAIIHLGRVVVQDELAKLLAEAGGVVQMRIERAEDAAKAFGSFAHNPVRHRDGKDFIVDTSEMKLEEIQQSLGEQGLYPSEIKKAQGLEQLFLDLTGGNHG